MALRIELRPLVPGRIASINFVLEQEVRKDDVLLTIDPSRYEIALNKAQREPAKARWQHSSPFEVAPTGQDSIFHPPSRAKILIAASKGASAAVRQDKEVLDLARINLANTRVVAPIAEIVGRVEVSLGSLVQGG